VSVTLRETFTIDGVLADVTSVKLSDPTATFGVKRNDTGAIIVADGTDMVKVGTGTYEYIFAEPAFNLTYTYWVEWVYGGETYRDEHTKTGTTDLPVTIARAKEHLRVTHDNDDAYILDLIKAATDLAELFQQRTYIQRQRTHKLAQFPCEGNGHWIGNSMAIVLPYPPLIGVGSIQYVDENGAVQTLAPAKYQVDTYAEPGKVVPAYEESWPATRDVPNAVTVIYTAGYGTADDAPTEVKQAILLIVGHFYENRINVSDSGLTRIPDGAWRLLWPARIVGV